ncbi:MAG: phosphatase family protein [Flavipsychrobacter sp.]|jgi:membrane-associated phospholipid phosphatase|nr:phosphatase family protein [Flavipsychrobacter sp.]
MLVARVFCGFLKNKYIMRFRSWILCSVIVICSVSSFAQESDTLRKQLDSMRKDEKGPGNKPIIDVDKEEYTSSTNITPKAYFVLLATDFKHIGTSPLHASKKTWIKVGELVLLEGAMFFADKPIRKYSQEFMANNPGMRRTSEYITNFGGMWEVYTLAAFGAYGVIFKSNKVKTTTLLATQAYITAGAVSSVVKYATGRVRPNFYDPNNPKDPDNAIFYGPPIFDSRSYGFNSSFPSGHTTAAFAAATVFAYEYKDQILIPAIAYTAAGLVGISRITENAHWATDVIAGFALGYICGKQVVYNYHRYARLMASKKMSFNWNLNYSQGVIMPGLVCTF